MANGSLTSVVATLFDNSTHGEDSFLIRDLGNGHFLDAVMDGVTGHGGEEASTSVAQALESANITSPEDVVEVLEEQNGDFYQVGGGRFLLTTVSVALYLGGPLYIISAGDSPIFHIRAAEHKQLSGRIGGILRMGTAQAIGAGQNLNLHRGGGVVGSRRPPGYRVRRGDRQREPSRVGRVCKKCRYPGSGQRRRQADHRRKA